MIPEHFIQQLIDQVKIVDYISSYVQLKLSGSNYFGLCPFHGEKSPSFSVSPSKNLFYCFGCQKGGNVISFAMDINHITFPETIEMLAKEYHLEVPQTKKVDPHKNNLIEVLSHAKDFYCKVLLHPQYGLKYRNYLKERNISINIQKTFQIGCTPESPQHLTNSALKSNFKISTLTECGLSKKRKEEYFDYFLQRIIFPIFNESGKVIAFGGRIISSNFSGPKYLNSPESDVFKKSATLYGLHIAKKEIIKKNEVILVEGYMDVLRLHEHEITHAIATLGTSFSKKHSEILKRLCKNVIIINDNDLAGIKATLRSLPILLRAGLNVYVYFVSEGKDPDEFLSKNSKEVFMDHMNSNMQDSFSFFYQKLLNSYSIKQAEERKTIVDKACEFIQNYTHSIEVQDRLKQLSIWMDISLEIISKMFQQSLQKIKEEESSNNTSNEVSSLKTLTQVLSVPIEEKILIAFVLEDPSYIHRINQALGELKLYFKDDSFLFKILNLYQTKENISFNSIASQLDPKGTFLSSLEEISQKFDLKNDIVFTDAFQKLYKKFIDKRLAVLKNNLSFCIDSQKPNLRLEMNKLIKAKHKKVKV